MNAMSSGESKKIRLHHVGVVVKTDNIKNLIRGFIGIGERTWYVETQGVDVTFLPLGNAYIELVYPHGNKTIDKYLETRGEGIHHFCFEVDDLDYWAKRCEENGFKVVSRDHRCFFIHPKTFGGILVEFIMMSKGDPMRELTLLER
ncbi:VOC family protein [Candidatus Bathyarchaeota archaeon]|nr:VOC family protein [Candidatus Bathyarchaeota archaeon]